jgi:chromosome segregation protein
MRIKQLELLGFKSFKQKTTLTFPEGITAVVGPNGCGKSNIVDALRWVLGEQSAKHLRGQEMSDVVFAGNDSSAPLGMADVSLLLENVTPPDLSVNGTNGHNGAYKNGDGPDWTEVMVSRRYFRSGDSEYLFNKIPCRLRDIVEFFLGTGAGTKAYSIIEQGRVEALINAKAQDIRILVEEAAGVSLYRSRRLAAERKLERTRENLSRVSDLLHEMDRQLGTLRRQAKKAEQYKVLQDELKTIDLTLQSRAYQALTTEVSSLVSRQAAVGREEEQLHQKIRTLQAERMSTAERAAREEDALRELEERIHTLESTLQQSEQKQSFRAQQEEQVQLRLADAEHDYRLVSEKKAQMEQEFSQRVASAAEVAEQIQYDADALQTQEQVLADLQDTALQHESQVEELKTEMVDLLTQESQVKNALAYSRERTEEVSQRLELLADKAKQVGQLRAEREQALAALQEKSSALHQRVQHGQQQREAKDRELQAAIRAGEQLDTALSEARARQAELQARLTTLEELEQGYDRYDQGVQSVMSDCDFPAAVLGVVAQMIEVPQAYERAVAAVLREKLEYMVVTDTEAGVVAVGYLNQMQSGHGHFIPLQLQCDKQTSSLTEADGPMWATVGEGVSPLIRHVDIPPDYRQMVEALLGDVVLVPNLRVGLELWNQSQDARTYVTPQGEVISALGGVSGGSGGIVEAGLLERRREIRGLRQELSQQAGGVSDLVEQRQTLKQRQQALEGELRSLNVQAQKLGQENEALQREAGQLEGEVRRLLDRGEGVSYEQNALEQERQSLQADIQKTHTQALAIAAQRQEREDLLAVQQVEMEEAKEACDQHRTQMDDLRVRLAEHRERYGGLQTQVDQLRRQMQDLEERIQAAQADIQAGKQEAERLLSEKAALEDQMTQTLSSLDSTKAERTRRDAECAQIRAAAQQCETLIEENRQAATQLQEEKSRVEVSLAEKRVSREHLEETVQDRYQVKLTAVLSACRHQEFDQAEGEARRQELREKLARLGEVNPNAAVELDEVQERFTSIESQKADLLHSIEDLQSTINKLNRESRDRFRETFHRVNAKFGEVYARLVEGGQAHITLTNEADLSESGVELEVQPPGKRLRSMQLLSGGEKALAALSFTFALFLIRPSPFCILDEVDAPLDDANVGRFNQLLREMSETTQIVLITHNKRTMEVADTLYGVTMQEPGVSTMVSVRVS